VSSRGAILAGGAAAAAAVAFLFTTDLKRSSAPSLSSLRNKSGLVVFTRDGKPVDLGKSTGKVALIHFWATWCPPCVEELPELQKFWDRFRKRGDIDLYAVSVDDSWKDIEEFRRGTPFDLPVFLDSKASTAHRFGSRKFPETYVVGRDGRVLYHLSEAVDWDSPEIEQNIETVLARK
jgi:thiol-disulfide isomerase/thioredoxin